MKSFSLFDRRIRRITAAIGILLAAVAPATLPFVASAAQIQTRSIALSSATAGAKAVNYEVKFTPATDADAVVIDFCQDSPLVGTACTAPSGLKVKTSPTATAGFTATKLADSTIQLAGTITKDTPIDTVIDNIDNPTATGTFYARILTYLTANLGHYTATDPDNGGTNPHIDDGGVALSTTTDIGVTGAVLESLTFCAAKNLIDPNCDLTTTPNPAPTLRLGQDLGNGVLALGTTLSTGSINTQITTNAVGGAVVSLKSDATNCGGMKLIGSNDVNNCFISPAGASDIAAGEAKFGVHLGTATNAVGAPNPIGTVVPAAYYDTTHYRLNGQTDNSTGVTSSYGDPFMNTNGAPANNQNMALTFGAQVSNNTPAGLYSANLSLIATGTF